MLAVLDGTAAEAASLVRVGLWETTTDGWQFHDWDDYNEPEDVAKDRRTRRGSSAAEANHIRWHVKKGVRSASCALCNASDSDSERSESDSESDTTSDTQSDSDRNPPEPEPVIDTRYLPEESPDPAARDFSPDDLETIRNALADIAESPPDDLTAATTAAMLLEQSPRPVANAAAYVRRCVERSPRKVRSLLAAAARQATAVHDALGDQP
jgi:hypothetical protein